MLGFVCSASYLFYFYLYCLIDYNIITLFLFDFWLREGWGLGWVYVRGCGVEFGWGLVEWGSVSVVASGWLVLWLGMGERGRCVSI